MVILVDDATWPWRGRVWAHLVSDESLAELHSFADELGLRRAWFQGDHYDVPASVRAEALARGAAAVPSGEIVRRLRAAGLRRAGARLRIRARLDVLFTEAEMARVVLPRPGTGVDPVALGQLAELLRIEHGELAAELGAPVTVVLAGDAGRPHDDGAAIDGLGDAEADDGTHGRSLVRDDDPGGDLDAADDASLVLRVDPTVDGPILERESPAVVTVVGRDLDEVVDGLSLLRTARRTGADRLDTTPADDVREAVARLEAEVAATYPGFDLRGLDWAAVSAAHREEVDEHDPLPGLQRWVARLADAHTAVRRAAPQAPVPLTARVVDGRVAVVEVAAGTALADAGVGPGWVVEVADLDDLASRWGASPHGHPWTVARRAVSGPAGESLPLALRSPDGAGTTVEELAAHGGWHDHLHVEVLASGTAVLRLRQWSADDLEALDDLLGGLDGRDRLLVDLRGNPGGALVAAASFRERFVSRPTTLGTVRYSTGDGGLTAPTPIVAEPSDRVRWNGRVRFLTDGLTYSASEDAIAGLQQLPSVDVVGTPSGGGSGRARTVPLLDGIVLTCSTALTYDHTGRCIEGAGVVPDTLVALPTGPDGWAAADRDW